MPKHPALNEQRLILKPRGGVQSSQEAVWDWCGGNERGRHVYLHVMSGLATGGESPGFLEAKTHLQSGDEVPDIRLYSVCRADDVLHVLHGVVPLLPVRTAQCCNDLATQLPDTHYQSTSPHSI